MRPLIRRFDVLVGCCAACGQRVRGRHPLQTSDALGAAGVHLGPGVVTLVVLLRKHAGMPFEKIATLLRERFGLTVTPGGLVHALHRAARVAAPTYAALCEQIRGSPVVSPDETGWRVGARLHGLWAFATPTTTVFGGVGLEILEGPEGMGKEAQLPSLARTARALAVLFLADLGFAGQGLLSLFVAGVGLSLLTSAALWAAIRGGATPLVRSRAMRAGMYLLLGIATVATTQFHMATAQNHAAQVIQACRAYQARHGMLPDRLEELVPEFLPRVPRAKYTLQWGEFTYLTSGKESHTLMYVALPPFGRRLYHFEAARWSQLD